MILTGLLLYNENSLELIELSSLNKVSLVETYQNIFKQQHGILQRMTLFIGVFQELWRGILSYDCGGHFTGNVSKLLYLLLPNIHHTLAIFRYLGNN